MPSDNSPAADALALRIAGRPRAGPLAGKAVMAVGRGTQADIRFPQDTGCSREQLRFVRRSGGWAVEPLSQTIATLVNGRAIGEPTALAPGDQIAFSTQLLTVVAAGHETDEAAQPPRPRRAAAFDPAPDSEPDATPRRSRPGPAESLAETGAGQRATRPPRVPAARTPTPTPAPGRGERTAFAPRDSLVGTAALDADIPLTGDAKIGRDPAAADIVLDHPAVSRAHAQVRVRAGQIWLRDLGSSNGTFVNGERLGSRRQLVRGDTVDIGPYSLTFTGEAFARASRAGNTRIVASDLVREVPGPDGAPVRILDDVSLVIEPNEFVCLLGPSGSGKTTLMNALSARAPADRGQVLINDQNLYENFAALKEDIALVPQHDVLHEELTLAEALAYTAKLRLPADTPARDIREEVGRVVRKVELEHRLTTPIARFSGGQKKRASLANETVIQPSLLFLDEVTSGLDEGTDWEMMRLFRQMAESGVTVVCVTHTLANVAQFCHKVAIMANPGVLVFYGSPAEALDFFQVDKLADIYRKLPQKPSGEWQLEFEESDYCRRYVSEAAPAVMPAELPATTPPVSGFMPVLGDPRSLRLTEIVRQFGILAHRYTKLLLADRKTLATALAQAGVIGLLLAMVFGAGDGGAPHDSSLLFLLGISALWLGCNNASKEIVKERPIYQRERDVNLSVPAYLAAKMVVIGGFSLVLVAILFLITLLFAHVPGSNLGQLAMMAVSALVGTALGLLISAASKTRDQANTLVPLALIPQIVLAGVIVPDLPWVPDLIAQTAISGFWTYDGMMAVLADGVGDALGALTVLAAHFVAFLGAALAILVIRDRRGR